MVGAAGTTMRFLTASLEGGGRMDDYGNRTHEEPSDQGFGGCAERFRRRIEYMEKEGYPPLRIFGSALQDGEISLPGNVSSQYISAILMIAPLTENGVTLHWRALLSLGPISISPCN